MRRCEKQFLDKRLKDFQYEVVPNDLLPYLPCLIPEDKDKIQTVQKSEGKIEATRTLIDRLKRRGEKGLKQFVQALRKCGYQHTALLLDPHYNYKDDDNGTVDTDGSGRNFRRIGTAIDLKIFGSLLLEGSECCDMERYVAERFQDQKSEDNKKMRTELQKRLPQGIAFVDTATDSITLTFRLSSEQAAVELWDMYDKGVFQSILQTVLVEKALKDNATVPEKFPKLQISLWVEQFREIRKKFAEINSEEENVSLHSSPSKRRENGKVDDDRCEMVIPEVFLGENANSLGPCDLELRGYQKELAEPAIKGSNTIICAPKNSGKTYVAIEITKRHLESFTSFAQQSAACSTSIREPRLVFIASTTSLVLQQKERFGMFLDGKYPVGEISEVNSTEIPLKYLLQSHSVVVMTAPILLNALKSANKEERVELKDISLLLFDECHHAHKEHPYNSIMEKYLALKLQPGYQHRLPQIIGLTASLGTDKAPSVEKAEENIILVSANLDAEVISTVKKNKAELELFVDVHSQEIHHVPKNDQDPFEKFIFQVMAKIEVQLKKSIGKSYETGPPDKGGQQYRHWVDEIYEDSEAIGERYQVTFAEHLREYHIALTLNTNTGMKHARRRLQKYFDALDREKFTEVDESLEQLFHKAMRELNEFIQKNGDVPENPRTKKLKELLLQNYEEIQQSSKDQLSKTGKGRESKDGNQGEEKSENSSTNNSPEKADNKEDNMSEDIEAPKSAWTRVLRKIKKRVTKKERRLPERKPVSKGNEVTDYHNEDKKSREAIQEDDESDETRTRYHSDWKGQKGILFTRTCECAEALLDWIKETKELNAVLRPVLLVGSGDGNIGMTQYDQEEVIKRFRTGENNLLLATSVAGEGLDISDCNYVIRYDMMGDEISSVQSRRLVRDQAGALERVREILMTEALTKVQNMNPEKFELAVKDVQRRNYWDRYLKKHICAFKMSVRVPNDVTFLCRKCKEVVCQAQDVRRFKGSHHVIINSDVRDTKVNIRKHPNPEVIDDYEIRKNIFCKKCDECLGVTAVINRVEWMCFSISSFFLRFPNTDLLRMCKRWEDFPFGFEEVSIEELSHRGFDKGPANHLLDVEFDL